MLSDIYRETESKMEKTIESMGRELAAIRTGRASLSIFDGITLDYYGSQSPLNQVATLSVPESRLIVIQPWDPSIIKEIEKAIMRSDLGLTPNNDGKLIRLSVPPLTEERRKDLVKMAKKLGEDGKVRIRGIRREANEEIKKSEKDSDITEDESHKMQDKIQKLTDKHVEAIDKALQEKEDEILNF